MRDFGYEVSGIRDNVGFAIPFWIDDGNTNFSRLGFGGDILRVESSI